jgi:hypothetical protein
MPRKTNKECKKRGSRDFYRRQKIAKDGKERRFGHKEHKRRKEGRSV